MSQAKVRSAEGLGVEVEAQVAEAVTHGDYEAAATAVIQGYGPQVLGYLRSVVRDDEEAEDAFAVFAENVWRGLPSWERRASVRVWAYSVAWNAATRVFRDPWLRRRRELPPSAASCLVAEVMSTSRRDQERRRSALEQLRGSLGPEEQSLLVLRVDRGLSWGEVAQAMGAADDHSGRAALRKRFERLKERLAADAKARGLLGDA